MISNCYSSEDAKVDNNVSCLSNDKVYRSSTVIQRKQPSLTSLTPSSSSTSVLTDPMTMGGPGESPCDLNRLENSGSLLSEQRLWLSQLQVKHRSLANKLENQKRQLTTIHNQLIYFDSSKSNWIEQIPSLKELAFTQWDELLSLRQDCDEIKMRYSNSDIDHGGGSSEPVAGTSSSIDSQQQSVSSSSLTGNLDNQTNFWIDDKLPTGSSTVNRNCCCPNETVPNIMIKQEMSDRDDKPTSPHTSNLLPATVLDPASVYPSSSNLTSLDKSGSGQTTTSNGSNRPSYSFSPNSNDLKNSLSTWKVPNSNESPNGLGLSGHMTNGLAPTATSDLMSDSSTNGLAGYSMSSCSKDSRRWSATMAVDPPSSIAISLFNPIYSTYSTPTGDDKPHHHIRNGYTLNGWLGSESSESQASSDNCYEMVSDGFDRCQSSGSLNNPMISNGAAGSGNGPTAGGFCESFNASSPSSVSSYSYNLSMDNGGPAGEPSNAKSPPYLINSPRSNLQVCHSGLSFIGRDFMPSNCISPDHGSNISN